MLFAGSNLAHHNFALKPMPKVLIENLDNTVVSSNDNSQTVLNIIHENQIDWMHACGAKGRCTTCKIIVKKGMENLSPMSEAELRFAGMGKLGQNERLACQSRLLGDIAVRVAEANKFPHVEYSN